MTKRCKDCKHTRGIGFDFWCGEGHIKYESLGETDCPYFEYHDWSKGIPSRTKKRFTYDYEDDKYYDKGFFNDNGKEMFKDDVLNRLNTLHEENNELKEKYNEQSVEYEGLKEQVERLQDFKDKVFNLINAEIRRGEQIIDGGERIGANVSVMIFHIVLLKRLKEELI